MMRLAPMLEMVVSRGVVVALLLLAAVLPQVVTAAPARPAYPPSHSEAVSDRIHGVTVRDPYRWLENAKSSEVQAWMKAQDRFARSWLARLPGHGAIAARLKQLYYVDSMGLPQRRGGRLFYSRRLAHREKSVIYWREGDRGPERVLLDPNQWSKDGSRSLGDWSVSWDGRQVAYQVHRNNSDEATLYVSDVTTGVRSTVDVIEGAKYATASWEPGSQGFYYTWLPVDAKIPAAERPGYAEVRFHRMGRPPAEDEVVKERTGDPTTFVGGSVSRDGHWLMVNVYHGWASSDVYFRDLRTKGRELRPLVVGQEAQFTVWPHRDRFYVLTDMGAPFGRLMRVDPSRPAVADWVELVAERKGSALQSFGIVGGRLVLGWLRNVASRVEVANLDGRPLYSVKLPGLGTASVPSGNEDEDTAWFSFTSFTVPSEIHRISLSTGRTTAWFRPRVPVDASSFVVEQVSCVSKDGTRVPVFVIHRKGLKPNGRTPTILYGYGGFQSGVTPAFTAYAVPWLERGGVYAVANLRGGDEFGEDWHRQGMLLEKQHVFDDFIAAAELLTRRGGWTDSAHLGIKGASNGGLLVGAAMTQRPDLFRVVLCGVPLLDMVRYHLFGSGKTWVKEYGSAEDARQFQVLYGYSPYHHVKRGVRYPAVLVDSADSDDRVDPLHARKFVAELQNDTTGGPVLLRIERNAGHGGADMVKASILRAADQYVFVLSQMGLRP